MPLLYKEVVGSAGGALGLLFLSEPRPLSTRCTQLTPVLGIWAFAAIGSLTAASRCTWAFSRDGGIPGSQWWRVVSPRYELPLNALALSTVACALLGLIYLGSSAAFNAFTGGRFAPLSAQLTPVATICLGCSYAYPVLCSVIRGRKMVKNAPFSLGKFGFVVVCLDFPCRPAPLTPERNHDRLDHILHH